MASLYTCKLRFLETILQLLQTPTSHLWGLQSEMLEWLGSDTLLKSMGWSTACVLWESQGASVMMPLSRCTAMLLWPIRREREAYGAAAAGRLPGLLPGPLHGVL